ncbi:hypothetical protein V6N13_074755 [Hibiscus sabdariffa]|uniref:Uncharacterized protein n=1 Tax=Hibiscus sabdariffa TaxID=183260 RepID=A0ABR2U9H6_9ROSI
MADEFTAGIKWWDRTTVGSSSPSSSGLNNSLGTSGWAPEMADIKATSSMDSTSQSPVVFQDNPKLQAGAGTLHMMELGLSSQAMDWNQAFMRRGKSEDGLKSILEEHNLETSGANYHQQELEEFKYQSSQWSPSTILQGLMSGTENNQVYQYEMDKRDHQLLPNSWSKVPQFLRNSPSKHGQLHFSNNAPFWNPSAAASMGADTARPLGFFPALQTQFQTEIFDKKPKNISEVPDSSTVVKKSGNGTSAKRSRSETQSLPAFKTDTASVLSEAIEYIKFLHDQVDVLSTPYMKNGAATHHQQYYEKAKDPEEIKQDLRSRGLFLVPVSGTFPAIQESTVGFWTPTFGGTYR